MLIFVCVTYKIIRPGGGGGGKKFSLFLSSNIYMFKKTETFFSPGKMFFILIKTPRNFVL